VRSRQERNAVLDQQLMSMASQGSSVVAVVNGDGDRTAVWHVAIGAPMPQMSRLCGAWVTDGDRPASAVVAARLFFPVGGQVPDAVADLVPASTGVFDMTATLAGISKCVDELDARHTASKTKAGKPHAPINWPKLPEALDWVALPDPPIGVVDDPLISTTIRVALWVAELADAWSAVETTRLQRKHLAEGDTSPSPLPVVTSAADAAE
jgi:hypothetical protein